MFFSSCPCFPVMQHLSQKFAFSEICIHACSGPTSPGSCDDELRRASSHQGITSGIHPWNGRSPKGVRDDSSHGIHLATELFSKRRSLKHLGGDKTSATRSLSLRGKHHLL